MNNITSHTDGEAVLNTLHPAITEGSTSRQRLLRHRLTSPEKRTVKRVQAQRVEFFMSTVGMGRELARSRICSILKDDRGLLEGQLDETAYETMSGWLIDEELADQTAAEIIGVFLRQVGAMERPELSAPRVKAALRALNDAQYSSEKGAIPDGVREFRLEKRDGGMQIVALLRTGAPELDVEAACKALLTKKNLGDVDVRMVARR